MSERSVFQEMDAIEEGLRQLEDRISSLHGRFEAELIRVCADARQDATRLAQLQGTLEEARREISRRMRMLRCHSESYVLDTAEHQKKLDVLRDTSMANLYSSLSAMGLSFSRADVEDQHSHSA